MKQNRQQQAAQLVASLELSLPPIRGGLARCRAGRRSGVRRLGTGRMRLLAGGCETHVRHLGETPRTVLDRHPHHESVQCSSVPARRAGGRPGSHDGARLRARGGSRRHSGRAARSEACALRTARRLPDGSRRGPALRRFPPGPRIERGARAGRRRRPAGHGTPGLRRRPAGAQPRGRGHEPGVLRREGPISTPCPTTSRCGRCPGTGSTDTASRLRDSPGPTGRWPCSTNAGGRTSNPANGPRCRSRSSGSRDARGDRPETQRGLRGPRDGSTRSDVPFLGRPVRSRALHACPRGRTGSHFDAECLRSLYRAAARAPDRTNPAAAAGPLVLTDPGTAPCRTPSGPTCAASTPSTAASAASRCT